MSKTRRNELRRRFVQGILLGLRPQDLHEYVSSDEEEGVK
jgi:hypothetical protein